MKFKRCDWSNIVDVDSALFKALSDSSLTLGCADRGPRTVYAIFLNESMSHYDQIIESADIGEIIALAREMTEEED